MTALKESALSLFLPCCEFPPLKLAVKNTPFDVPHLSFVFVVRMACKNMMPSYHPVDFFLSWSALDFCRVVGQQECQGRNQTSKDVELATHRKMFLFFLGEEGGKHLMAVFGGSNCQRVVECSALWAELI